MYNSQYYTCEQIDQRLLQGYLDDYNTENGTSLTKAQFLAKLGSILGIWKGVDEEPTPNSDKFVKSKGIIPVFYSVYGSILNEDTQTKEAGKSYGIDIQVNLKKGTVIEFSLDSNDGAVVEYGAWAVTYPTGEVTNVAKTRIGQSDKYTLIDDCSRLRLYAPVTTGGTITSTIKVIGLNERVDTLKQDVDTLDERVDTLVQDVDTLEQDVYGSILNEDTQTKEAGKSYGIDIQVNLKKGTVIEFSLDSNDGAKLGSGGWGVTYPTGEVTDVVNIGVGQTAKYALTDNCSRIRCWYLVTTGGTITSKVETKGLIEETGELEKRTTNLVQDVDTLEQDVYGSILNEDTQTKEAGKSYGIDIQVNLKKGTVIEFSLDSNDGAVVEYGAWAVTYPTGEVTNVAKTRIGQSDKYTLIDDCSRLRLYAPVTTGGTITSTIKVIGLNERVDTLKQDVDTLDERVDDLKQNIHQGKILSILGDSYSTYGLWIPTTSTWYAINGEDGHNSDANNNVNNVSQTWWYKLCNRLRVSLLLNDSYSGSPICNTGYNQSDASSYSFIHRMINSLGVNNALKVKPNIIIIFGGTNDSWADSPIGELKYSDWTEDDLKSVLPAMCYMFDYIKKWNPGALIINVVNTGLKNVIADAFTEATSHYSIHNIVLDNIGKTGGHPNISGMSSICDQIYDVIHSTYE